MYTTKNILDDLSLLGLKELGNEKQIKYSWKKTLKKVHPDIDKYKDKILLRNEIINYLNDEVTYENDRLSK